MHRLWLVTVLVWAGCYVETPTHRVSGAIETESDADPVIIVMPEAGTHDDATAPSLCDCSDEQPVCLEGSGLCVQCTQAQDQACVGATPVCHPAESRCVGCLLNGDCTAASASVCGEDFACQACESDSDCAHIEGKHVCDAGECVECTAAERTACRTSDGEPAACDGRARECTEHALGATSTCGTCVSDAQCAEGQACVELMVPGGEADVSAGFFCQWVREGGGRAPTTCEEVRPFSNSLTGVASVDAPDALLEICTLRASTCADFLGFDEPCGRYRQGQLDMIVSSYADEALPPEVRGQKLTVAYIDPDDSVCGPRSMCAAKAENTGAYRCTMACIGREDCKRGSYCTVGDNQYCSVN